MRKNIRRISPAHPEVALIPRKFKKVEKVYEYWVARWRDSDTGKLVEFKLDSSVFPSRESRREWAIKKSRTLAKRTAELASGAPVITRTPLNDAVEAYLEACTNRLRPRTMEVYQDASNKLLLWAKENGVKTLADFTPAKLTAFREYRIGERKQGVSKGGRRGARKSSSKKRSPSSINIEFRSVKTMLLQWRTEEKLPNIDRETIARCLKSLPMPREAPAYLSSGACRKLLDAAIRHDSETFSMTRDEHDRLRPVGSTLRYDPIAPFVLFLLLSGCRLGEALNLRWSDIDLDALDAEGRTVGEIRLQGTATKTKQWRVIGLEVCPSLRSLLAAMKLKSGGQGYVFGDDKPLPSTRVSAARKRLIKPHGATKFSWQNLRQTTGTFLTNAPGIFGAASVFMSARQLGHSVTVAERHYLGVVRGIPREARTLEQAMQIEKLANQIVANISTVQPVLRLGGRSGKK